MINSMPLSTLLGSSQSDPCLYRYLASHTCDVGVTDVQNDDLRNS